MIVTFYSIAFILSVVMSMVYLCMWHKHFDVHITIVFVVAPVINLGYVMLAKAQSLDAALFANQITYLGGCFLLPFIMLSVLQLCRINSDRRINVFVIVISTLMYLSSLTIGISTIFYKSVDIKFVNGTAELVKTYGPLHTLFYVMMVIYFLVSMIVTVYSFFRKIDVSNKIVIRLFITEFITIVAFFGGRAITKEIEFVPMVYVIDQIIYLTIVHRMCLYDIMDTGMESLVQSGDTGLISFDFKYRYLGSNRTAMNIFPQLYDVKVDTSIEGNKDLENTILVWIKEFEKNRNNNKFPYNDRDKSYFIEINYLYDGKHKKGYQIFIKDNTREQEYIAMLNKYNANLQNKLDELYTAKGNK